MPKKNHIRRLIGVLICSLPIVPAIICTVWPKAVSTPRWSMGLTLVVMACLLGCLNFHLSFIRPRLYRRKHGSMEGYRFVSGIPVVGSLLQIAGCVIALGSTLVGLWALLAALLDTGGLPWIPVLTWKDSSFWDG